MKIDLHVHSKYSYDCDSEPEEIIECAVLNGLDGLLITEHNSFAASEPWELLATNSTKNRGLLILRGVEISTSTAHVIAIGFQDDSWNPWKNPARAPSVSEDHINLYELLIRIHEMGGASIIAHPYRQDTKVPLLEDFDKIKHFTTAEGINGLCSSKQNYRAIEQMRSWNRAYTGGSDAHRAEHVGRAFTEFEDPVRDLASLIDELKAGRFVGRYGATRMEGKD